MGVLNVTPDSFSDGGRYRDPRDAIARGLELVAEGADIIDIGGESTRPGAAPPGTAEELDRVMPVIEGLRQRSEVLLSVDTSDPAVMHAAVAAGVDMLNDVRALARPGALAVAAAAGLPVCLMHMRGEPGVMQADPRYDDVLAEVCAFLAQRAAECLAVGMARNVVILDPGFGFGKTLAHNLTLIRHLDVLADLGYPVLAGLSRKSMIAQMLREPADARPADGRLAGSLALALAARSRGAGIVRVHDVGPTVQAFGVMEALDGQEDLRH